MARRFRRTRRNGRLTLRRVNRRLGRLSRRLAPEVKHYEETAAVTVSNDYNIGLGPTAAIAQGDATGERVGDAIRLKSYRLRLQPVVSAAVGSQPMRVIVFSYKSNPDGIVNNITTLTNLLLDSAFANTTNATRAWYDWDNHGVFDILYDKTRIVFPSNAYATTASYHIWDINVKFPNARRVVQYQSGSTVITENALYVIMISDHDGVVGVNYTWRLTYTDV